MLDPLIVEAFAKEAATVSELQAGYRRLAPTRVPTGRETVLSQYVGLAGPGTLATSPQAMSRISGVAQEQGVPLKDVLALPEVGKTVEMSKRYGGTIAMPPGGWGKQLTGKAVKKTYPQLAPTTAEGEKAVNIVAGMHEGFERGVKPHEMFQISSHLSPKVLMHEHNLLQHLEGPGAEEAKKTFGTFRQLEGTTPLLMGLVEKHYGPRGVELVKNMGFTKAMKKHLMSLVQAGKFASGDDPKYMKELQPGDVVSFETGRAAWPGRLGEAASKLYATATQGAQGSYTHSGIYVGKGEVVESAIGRGVFKRPFREAIKHKSFMIHRPLVPKKDRTEAASFAKEQVGKGYDATALVATSAGTILPDKFTKLLDMGLLRKPREAKKWTCSNLVTAAYDKAKLTTLEKIPTPADIQESGKVRTLLEVKRRQMREKAPLLSLRLRRGWWKRPEPEKVITKR